jgi:hypothetical protein
MAVRRRAGPGEGPPAPSGGGSSILGVRSGSDASFSICFAVGIRHDTGRSFMPDENITRTKKKPVFP